MQIPLADLGQVIRPQQVVAPTAPTAGATIMAPAAPVRVDPSGAARQAARDRILRRNQVADAKLARQQEIEDAILARQQQIEDAEYERQIEIDDAAYDDEKYLRDQKYKDDRADQIARIKRSQGLADDVRDRGRELADRDDTREYQKGVLEEQRDYDAELREEEYKREDEIDKRDYERGATERKQAREKHNQFIKESNARLAESKKRKEVLDQEALFNTKKMYAEFLNEVATNKEATAYRQNLDRIIESLSVEEEALQSYAINKTISAVNNIVKVYLDVGLDGDGDEWVEQLFEQNGLSEVQDIGNDPELAKALAFSVMSQVQENPTLTMSIAPLAEVKSAMETAASEQKQLVEQMKQFQIARTKASNKTIDPAAVEVMKKAFRTRIGHLGEDAFEEVESKTTFDEDGTPRGTPADEITEDVDGNKVEEKVPEVSEKDKKDFLDDLSDADPMEEAIKDTEAIDESNSSATIKPASEGASTFVEAEGTDEDNMTEPEEFNPRSITLNTADVVGKGLDVLDRMDLGGVASDAASFAGENAEIIAPLGVAARKPIIEGSKKVGQAGANVIKGGADAISNSAAMQALTKADPDIGNIDDVVPDVDPNKPVEQRWMKDGQDITGIKGVPGAEPVKVTNLMGADSVDSANKLLESKGLKPYTEPMPDPHPNKKIDLKQRAEWQLKFRDHVNKQIQGSRTALRTRLMSAIKAMKPGMPQGKLGKFLKVLGPAAAAYEVIALGKDVYELLSREDPEAAQAVQDQLETEEAGVVAEEGMASITEEIKNSMGSSEEVSMPIEEMNNSAEFSSGQAGTYDLPPNLAEALRMSNE